MGGIEMTLLSLGSPWQGRPPHPSLAPPLPFHTIYLPLQQTIKKKGKSNLSKGS